MRYVHTNLIASDSAALIEFYKTVFGCRSIGETRDISGEWLDKLTGVQDAHIVGEHLCLPGYDERHPTLEIFSYVGAPAERSKAINGFGFGHIAFEVEDVDATLAKMIAFGGGQLGEVVRTAYPDGRKAVLVYAADPEGNIVELQSWSET